MFIHLLLDECPPPHPIVHQNCQVGFIELVRGHKNRTDLIILRPINVLLKLKDVTVSVSVFVNAYAMNSMENCR